MKCYLKNQCSVSLLTSLSSYSCLFCLFHSPLPNLLSRACSICFSPNFLFLLFVPVLFVSLSTSQSSLTCLFCLFLSHFPTYSLSPVLSVSLLTSLSSYSCLFCLFHSTSQSSLSCLLCLFHSPLPNLLSRACSVCFSLTSQSTL